MGTTYAQIAFLMIVDNVLPVFLLIGLGFILRQFRSPLIYVLAVAAVVSLALGEFKDAAFICGVLLINAIIGTIQEARAEKASQALRKLLTTRATVKRQGQIRELDAEFLVPGDGANSYLFYGNRLMQFPLAIAMPICGIRAGTGASPR